MTDSPATAADFPADAIGISHIEAPIHLRWRTKGRTLPLNDRRLRTLRALGVSSPLQSWIRSRLEWSLENLSPEIPEGILCLDISPEEAVTISFEPYRQLPVLTAENLVVEDDLIVGVAVDGEVLPGIVWVEQAGELVATSSASTRGDERVIASAKEYQSATDTFTRDLIQTFGYDVYLRPASASMVAADKSAVLFFTSDEFGLLTIGSQTGPVLRRLTECFDKLYA